MTNRERALRLLHYQPVDRLPAVHFGYWRELLFEWAEQGKISMEIATKASDGNAYDQELDKLLGWDFCWTCITGARMGLFPAFTPEVLEVLADGTERRRNRDGLIERFKPGVVSIPSEDGYTLHTREDFETLYRPKMQFSADRLPSSNVIEALKNGQKPDRPWGLNVGSVLGDIRSMLSVIGLSYLMYDEDETLLADIVDTYADMQYECVKAMLETGISFDFAHYWEDICYNSGALLSPDIFDELCAKHYKKRNDLCRQWGIDIISLDCDGVTRQLLPTWFDNGVNTMFPIEIGTWGDQFEAARNKFGQGMLGVGGMDKTAFLKDKKAVDAEIERMKRLASLGGFIPCPDHRLMPGSSFELVQYYTEEIKKISL